MDKKGAIKTIVGIMILLVLLVAILSSFFFPGSLAPTIAKGAERIGDSVLSGMRGEKFEKVAMLVDPAVEASYNDIVEILKEEGNGPCLLTRRAFPNDFEKSTITLTQKGEDISAIITNERGQRIRTVTIPGKELCVVAGEGAKSFYHNHLDDSKPCGTDGCQLEYTSVDLISFNKRNEINLPGGEQEEMKDGTLVFKAVDGNVCFFPTFGDMMGSCGEPKEGDIISPIMDDDCFKNGNMVKTNVKSCSELRAALPKIEIKNSGIGAYYQIDDYRLDIRWTNPTGGIYYLALKEEGEETGSIWYGGHAPEYAEVNFRENKLKGTEILTGQFKKYDDGGQFVRDYEEFEINLNKRIPSYPPLKTRIIEVKKGPEQPGQGAYVYLVTYNIINEAPITQECDELLKINHKEQIGYFYPFRSPISLGGCKITQGGECMETKSTQFAIYITDLELGKENTVQVGCGGIYSDEYKFTPT